MKKELITFIEKTRKGDEFELFLNMFRDINKIKFAVIKISGKVLETKAESLAQDIAFLNQFGIFPIVVHGAGSVLDRKLVFSKKINGFRITSKSDMEIIQKTFSEISQDLKQKIIKNGGKAKIAEDILLCEPIPELGYVGDITEIIISKLSEMIEKGNTPIISPLGLFNGNHLNINADTVAKELVKCIQPKKLIFITETGGILNKKKEIIPFLNVSEENFDNITGGMLLKVKEIKEYLSEGLDTAVVITSPGNLINELFTIKGSGTFIKYFKINSTGDINDLDKSKIKYLLENAFCKTLVPEYFNSQIKEVFYEKNYEGIAVIKELSNIPYLDKLAVLKSCQGTGLGKSLWNSVLKKYPKLILRASIANPLNSFYAKECDGFVKGSEWNVYWKGLSWHEAETTANLAMKKSKTLLEV